jgi:hypothetical protein
MSLQHTSYVSRGGRLAVKHAKQGWDESMQSAPWHAVISCFSISWFLPRLRGHGDGACSDVRVGDKHFNHVLDGSWSILLLSQLSQGRETVAVSATTQTLGKTAHGRRTASSVLANALRRTRGIWCRIIFHQHNIMKCLVAYARPVEISRAITLQSRSP